MANVISTPPAARALAVQALKVAQGYADAGVHEEGGNNRGDQVEYFQHLFGGSPGESWCAYFVCTCLVKGYAQLTGQPEGRTDLPHYVPAVRAHYLNLSGYCPDLAASARHLGIFHDPEFVPDPGDLVLYDFASVGEPHHVEIVRLLGKGRAAGRILTVGGNTSSGQDGNQANGDGVWARVRPLNHIYGYVHFG